MKKVALLKDKLVHVFEGIELDDNFLDGYEIVDREIVSLDGIHYLANDYTSLRKHEYDKLNQFELQFDDTQDGGTRWVDAINSIKTKYPKE